MYAQFCLHKLEIGSLTYSQISGAHSHKDISALRSCSSEATLHSTSSSSKTKVTLKSSTTASISSTAKSRSSSTSLSVLSISSTSTQSSRLTKSTPSASTSLPSSPVSTQSTSSGSSSKSTLISTIISDNTFSSQTRTQSSGSTNLLSQTTTSSTHTSVSTSHSAPTTLSTSSTASTTLSSTLTSLASSSSTGTGSSFISSLVSTSSSILASPTFTGVTDTNATSVSSCYQLPTPTASLLGIPFNASDNDGFSVPLVFYFSPNGSTLDYIGGDTNESYVLFDLTVADQIGIFVDEEPFIQFSPNGLTVFGPNCTWEEIGTIPNFYDQLQALFPLQAKRSEVLFERQTPTFDVTLELLPDCGSSTFTGPTADRINLLINNNFQCEQLGASYNAVGAAGDITYRCQVPGFTALQANCQKSLTTALLAIQNNKSWKWASSFANKVNGWYTKLISLETTWTGKIESAIENWATRIVGDTSLTVLDGVDKAGTAINKATPTEVGAVCVLDNLFYEIWIEWGNHDAPYNQMVGDLQITSAQSFTITAYLWQVLGLEDVDARCASVGGGNFSTAPGCTTAQPCSILFSDCPQGMQCLASQCCRGTSGAVHSSCVDPNTCHP